MYGSRYFKRATQRFFQRGGMTITLNTQFSEYYQAGYTACYTSRDIAIFALKEPFSLVAGSDEMTLGEYADLLISANKLGSSTKVKNKSGLKYFEYYYKNPETKDLYHYYTFVFKTSDSFWMVQFATLEKDADDYERNIFKWAKSIEFS